jgi:hypothetical protein
MTQALDCDLLNVRLDVSSFIGQGSRCRRRQICRPFTTSWASATLGSSLRSVTSTTTSAATTATAFTARLEVVLILDVSEAKKLCTLSLLDSEGLALGEILSESSCLFFVSQLGLLVL